MSPTHHRRGTPPLPYDPARLQREAEALGTRFHQRRLSLARFALGTLTWLWRLRRDPGLDVAFARWARLRMVEHGPVFVKLGQTLACRIDAFSDEVIAELSLLQDQVPGFPFEEVQRIVAEELGPARFAHIEPTPLAAASMGQVHAARLPDGREIVIKVLRPGLAETFAMDLTALRQAASWLERSPRAQRLLGAGAGAPFVALVDKLGQALCQQLDLWAEGLAGERFAANFAGQPRVGAPAIVWSHSGTRVLAQERIFGLRFDDEPGIRRHGQDYLDIAVVGVRAFIQQVFADAYFHADPHPGNVFVTAEGKVVFIDFGLVEAMDEAFQTTIVEVFLHAIQQDWQAFLDDLVRADIIPAEVPRERLIPIFEKVWRSQLGDGKERYPLQRMADEFYGVIRDYPFRLPERFIFLTRTAAQLEATIYRNDPDFKFLPVAMPSFAMLVLRRMDGERPWVLEDLMKVARKEGMLRRFAGILRMAAADDPERMKEVAAAAIALLLHPASGPLRSEVEQLCRREGLGSLLGLLPGGAPRPFELLAVLGRADTQAVVLESLSQPDTLPWLWRCVQGITIRS